MSTESAEKNKDQLKQLWFVPGVAIVAMLIVALLAGLFTEWSWYGWYEYYYRLTVVYWLINAAGFIFTGLYIAAPENLGAKKPSGANAAAGSTASSAVNVNAEGYCGMAKHVLLLFFTFGIWYLIWIYKMTNFLNRVEDEAPRGATAQLLLCLFVPFYVIYWVYKSAQRIDKMALRAGQQSDMAVLCLILAIFISIIPPILMQDKINSIVSAGPMGVVGGQPKPPVNNAPAAPVAAAAPANDAVAEIKAYKDLLDAGIITQEEFDAKKKQLLNV